MSELEAEMKEIQVSIEEAKKMVERADTLERLKKNPDFIKLIEEDYLREEAIRLTHLLDHPDQVMQASQQHIMNDLKGIAALRRYFSTVIQMGNKADDEIIAHENELEMLRSGEYEDIDGSVN